ncbi:MAG TPA: protein phosphatase 2C domain-containing protein [Thermoanaerobaculia bacterium]|jgi:serine/threonine protein phosphatase PrpC|nr:protein phosphatase 2C domain-containing protein [Thermoanaerobaculia bacterium]
MLRVRACGLSDVGLTRVHNEDYFEIDARHRLFVVADGMGGHSAGEVAAQIAVKAIHDFIEKSVDRDATRSLRVSRTPAPRATPLAAAGAAGRSLPAAAPGAAAAAASPGAANATSPAAQAAVASPALPASPDAYRPPQPSASGALAGVMAVPALPAGDDRLARHSRLLKMAVRKAHDNVLTAISKDGSLHGMGTTVVGLLLAGPTAAVAHVGDSRAYRLRHGRLDQLTQDHTWVHEQVVAGLLSQEQARSHPLKNVVTRALGGESEVLVDVSELQVQAGDIYLLCSDGLTGMLSDADIRERLGSGRSLHEICRSLVNEANARGGLDNVTVVLLSIEDSADEDGDQDRRY